MAQRIEGKGNAGREGRGKSVCMKKESGGRTYPLIQDLFNYGPSAGLSRGRF